MFVIFRDELIDSKDIAKKIESESVFEVITDLSKATKREDVISFKLSVPVKSLDIDEDFNWENDEIVEKYFNKAEDITQDFLQYLPRYSVIASSSYKWDEIEDKIYLVTVMANIDIKLKKLQLDILPRMLRQVD